MIEIGHEFVKNGIQFCVIDIIPYNKKQYCLLSVEKPGDKMNFDFYECSVGPNGGIGFNLVDNEELVSYLFELVERKGNNYE